MSDSTEKSGMDGQAKQIIGKEVDGGKENLKSSVHLDLHDVLHMYSMENSDASYAKNSTTQSQVFHQVQPLFKATLQNLIFPTEGPVRVADLGCATGSNTISNMDFVVRSLTNLCNNGSAPPEFQAFFCDLPSNDFNGLFNLLDPPNRPYLVAGVPGSFYNVLFPKSSIHVCFSIMALHWISEVPEAVLERDSPLYNRGKVWIDRGRQDVADIYSKHSHKDLTTFIKCRGEEMAAGGVLFLCLMGRPDTSPPVEQAPVGNDFSDFEDAWDDLVAQGIISPDSRDSFNVPWYFPNARELRKAVEENGGFQIERVEVCEGLPWMCEEEYEEWMKNPEMFGKTQANFFRSLVGSLAEAHIGVERADKLFQIVEQKAADHLRSKMLSRFFTCIVASLIKK